VADGSRVTEHHTLIEAAKRVPHGAICLLSALRFHGLTTQAPCEVWVNIAHKAHRSVPIIRRCGLFISPGNPFLMALRKRNSKALPCEEWSALYS
jgi:hypothetical protein